MISFSPTSNPMHPLPTPSASDPYRFRPSPIPTPITSDPLCFRPLSLPTPIASDPLRFRPLLLPNPIASDSLRLPTPMACNPLYACDPYRFRSPPPRFRPPLLPTPSASDPSSRHSCASLHPLPPTCQLQFDWWWGEGEISVSHLKYLYTFNFFKLNFYTL